MSRTARALEPRREEALLLEAARAFAEHGYRGASLNQTMTAAGWGKSSFYHYFADKRALYNHVVRSLRDRLSDGVRLPRMDELEADDFWSAMADLLAALGSAAERSPETRMLGQMFHRIDGPGGPDDHLEALRVDVAAWLRLAVARGRTVGAVRDDVPEPLLVELTTAVLTTLDRWAVDRALHSPGGPSAAQGSLELVRDLVGSRSAHPTSCRCALT